MEGKYIIVENFIIKIKKQQMIRWYSIVFLALLVIMSASFYFEPALDFGEHPLVKVDDIFFWALAVTTLSQAVAVITDNDVAYKIAFFLFNMVMGSLTFTYFVYSLFEILPFSRAGVLSVLLFENYLILPYLLAERKIDEQLSISNHFREEMENRR